jgi:hypothetical protein
MSTEALDETLEAHRRAVLGDRYDAPAPREQSYAELVADAVETERATRREARKAAQPSMAEFAAAERAKLRPELQRTQIILDHAAQYGYGSEKRSRL